MLYICLSTIPGVTDRGGLIVDELVELIDIFPTLVDLAGFPSSALPRCQDDGTHLELLCHEGASMVPLMMTSSPEPTKTSIFSDLKQNGEHGERVWGRTIMNKEYRYTLWVGFDGQEPVFGDVRAEELYDHSKDMGETINVVDDEAYRDVKKTMRSALRRGWREALTQE